MTFWKFLKDQKGYFLIWLFLLGFLYFYLFLFAPEVLTISFDSYLFFLSGSLLLLLLGIKYLKKRDYYRQLTEVMKKSNPYLEELDETTYEEKFVLELMQQLQKEKNQQLQAKILQQQDYQEYLNQWIHEIKIPLAALKLMNESLAEVIPEERFYQIETELSKIEKDVEQVLYYTRLDSFATDYLIEEVNLEEVIQEVLKDYANSFIMKHLQVEVLGETFTVLTDKKWLQFIVSQIVANSVKYTPDFGKVTISFLAGDIPQLEITDTGIGIAKEDLPRVFQKGFTGKNGRKLQKSTGLGLYLADKLALKLGHELKLTSKENQGTAVSISFLPVESLHLTKKS